MGRPRLGNPRVSGERRRAGSDPAVRPGQKGRWSARPPPAPHSPPHAARAPRAPAPGARTPAPPRRGRGPMAGRPARASRALHCHANIKEVKRRSGPAGRRVSRRWGDAWEQRQGEQHRDEPRRPALRPALPSGAPTRPVARPPAGRGWMRRGPQGGGGGPRPRAPGAPRGGVRGPGAPRSPCARARPRSPEPDRGRR